MYIKMELKFIQYKCLYFFNESLFFVTFYWYLTFENVTLYE